MGKFARLVWGLYDDGLKALSIFSTLLSIAFTIAKIFDAVAILCHVDYGWAFLPLTIWLLVAYVRRWSAFQDQIELPRAPLALANSDVGVGHCGVSSQQVDMGLAHLRRVEF
jgi:hypothetical protein